MLSADEWGRISVASSALCQAPIFLDDTASITVPEMKARLRRLKDLGFVVIDYLQLMHSARRIDNRVQEVSEITRSLKIMAKELNVPIMVCAQLSRGTERKGENHRPALAVCGNPALSSRMPTRCCSCTGRTTIRTRTPRIPMRRRRPILLR